MTAQLVLSGLQKAARLLISLGPEVSSDILKRCEEEEIERLTREIANVPAVPSEVRTELYAECYSKIHMDANADVGGQEYARHVLLRAVGERKADEILERIATRRIAPFVFMEETDPVQIASFLRDEHPQTVAVVLSHLSARQAANVLASFSENLQQEIAQRIAKMDRISPEILSQIEEGLQVKFSAVLGQDFTTSGGTDFLVKVLTQIDRSAEKTILGYLDESDEDLADEIRGKMFVFEDIAGLDNQAVQRVLQELDRRELALALKGSGDRVREVVFQNMSTRAREMLQEEVEILGAVRVSAVEQAQRKITSIVRRLADDEEIIIARGQGDAIIT